MGALFLQAFLVDLLSRRNVQRIRFVGGCGGAREAMECPVDEKTLDTFNACCRGRGGGSNGILLSSFVVKSPFVFAVGAVASVGSAQCQLTSHHECDTHQSIACCGAYLIVALLAANLYAPSCCQWENFPCLEIQGERWEGGLWLLERLMGRTMTICL